MVIFGEQKIRNSYNYFHPDVDDVDIVECDPECCQILLVLFLGLLSAESLGQRAGQSRLGLKQDLSCETTRVPSLEVAVIQSYGNESQGIREASSPTSRCRMSAVECRM